MRRLRALMEQRENNLTRMNALIETADQEQRAMSAEETGEFDRLETEIRNIDATIERETRARGIEHRDVPDDEQARIDAEERAFTDYVLGRLSEQRAGEQNLTMGNNGAIIPTSIATRIIKAIKDVSPILQLATVYHVNGTLMVPVWGDADGHNVTVGYQEEFTEITADAGKFTSVELGGYLAAALVLIGRSIETNAAFNVTDFIVSLIAEEIAEWIEGELLNGSGNKAATGALSCTNTLTAASTTAITADELITLQAKVKQSYQRNAVWIMHPDTYTAIKKLKDNSGRYLLQGDISSAFPYQVLSKPVYLSDNMPKVGSGAKSVLYGDPKGLSVNIRENLSIQVLREQYATRHALGVVAWFEFDSKVTDHQRMAVLVQAGA